MRARAWVPWAAVALLALVGPGARGGARPADRVWVAPDIADREVHTIAILPGVGGTRDAARAFGDRWFLRVYQAGYAWLPMMSAEDYLARRGREGDMLLDRLRSQVDRGGQVDSACAVQFSRALRVDALLILRIDRWERVGFGTTVAHIEALCTLQDSTGHLLWRVSGSEEVTARYGVPTGKVGCLPGPSTLQLLARCVLVPAALAASSPAAGREAGGGGGAPSTPPNPLPSFPRPGQPQPPGSSVPSQSTYPRYSNVRVHDAVGDARSVAGAPRSQGWLVPSQSVLAPDFDVALKRLLDRWVPLFPKRNRQEPVARSR